MEKTYQFAEKKVRVTFHYPYLADLCKGYEADGDFDYEIEITESDIENERKKATEGSFHAGYLESLAFYRKFCTRAARDNILLFHSFACEVDGNAYLFAAKSGTGKTTHGRLWKEMLGEKMHIINGDKPLIRADKDGFTVYGTPWNGKEHYGENRSAKIKAICFLERAKENSIERISPEDSFRRMAVQTFHPDEEEGLTKVVQNLLRMNKKIPCWLLKCNISKEAAELSYKTMEENQ